MRRSSKLSLLILAGLVTFGILNGSWRTLADAFHRRISSKRYSVSERQSMYGQAVRMSLEPYFAKAQVSYPPKTVVLVGRKSESRVEVYASDKDGVSKFIREYPILKGSGSLGPKLNEGDFQIPEGLYRIESLNPNSLFHLSLRVSYPNDFDRQRAAADGRRELGGDIMIHGSRVSVGCLAMGDTAAEELFILAADTGLENVSVILSPVDFRVTEVPQDVLERIPSWAPELYRTIKQRLLQLHRNEI